MLGRNLIALFLLPTKFPTREFWVKNSNEILPVNRKQSRNAWMVEKKYLSRLDY